MWAEPVKEGSGGRQVKAHLLCIAAKHFNGHGRSTWELAVREDIPSGEELQGCCSKREAGPGIGMFFSWPTLEDRA